MNLESQRKEWKYLVPQTDKEKKLFQKLWKDWVKKFNIYEKSVRLDIVKDFAMGCEVKTSKKILLNNDTLLIKNLKNCDMYNLHKILNNLGLHHKIINNNHILQVFHSEEWRWEYTSENPYSDTIIEFKEKYLKKQKVKRERNTKIKCDNCLKNANEVQILESVYICGQYCDDCLDEVSDGEGDVLSCHKFEPIC